MALFPGALPAAGSANASDTLATAGHTSLHNTGADESRAIANKLGTGASTPTSGMLLRGNGTGTSVWGQAVLTTDVSGVLPNANGGTGNANLSFPSGAETVVGRSVSETLANKTLTTPTIASLINANHNHQNSTGGGLLNAGLALSAGSVSFANLLSTIFADQVQSQANAGTAGGTMWWVNLGGIKLLWGKTAALTGGASSVYGVTLPTFFTTVQTGWCDAGAFGSDFNCRAGFNTGQPTTTSADIAMISAGGDSATAFWGLIGT